VNDSKIRALSAEVEELRPQNIALKAEIEALRRHLGLALGELKNPIVLPPPPASPPPEEEVRRIEEARLKEEQERDEMVDDFENEVQDLLSGLSLWRKKLGDDHARFGVAAH